jgi:hypothetical protein
MVPQKRLPTLLAVEKFVPDPFENWKDRTLLSDEIESVDQREIEEVVKYQRQSAYRPAYSRSSSSSSLV